MAMGFAMAASVNMTSLLHTARCRLCRVRVCVRPVSSISLPGALLIMCAGTRMIVRLRLQRFGRRNRPFYRMVAADSRFPRDGRFLEMLGTYNPIPAKDGVKEVRLKTDRIKYWLSVGADPSHRVHWLLNKFNMLPPKPYKPSSMLMPPKKADRRALRAQQKGGQNKSYSTMSDARCRLLLGLGGDGMHIGGCEQLGSSAMGGTGVPELLRVGLSWVEEVCQRLSLAARRCR